MKGVDDALRRLDGVKDIKIDLQTNMVTITPSPLAMLDLSAVPRAIDRAGFRPGRMKLRGHGTLEERDGALLFRLRNWPETYPWAGTKDFPPEGLLTARVDYSNTPPTLRP